MGKRGLMDKIKGREKSGRINVKVGVNLRHNLGRI